jgi:hypothetical protein
MALNGASSLGLSTMVHPAASAGATLHAIWLSGQFHGVMRPHTPMASYRTRDRPRGSSNAKSASTRRATRMCAAAAGAWAPRARRVGAPISCVSAVAMADSRATSASMMRSSSASRSSRLLSLKAGNAARAARTARSTSAVLPRLMRPTSASVAGSRTAWVLECAGSTHAPSM